MKTPGTLTPLRAVGEAAEEVLAVVRDEADRRFAAQLATERRRQTRHDIARHPHLTPKVASRLARSRDVDVRLGLAKNRATPGGIVASLATDDDKHVALAARTNPTCPWETVSEHGSRFLQLAHPACPPALLVEALGGRSHTEETILAHPNLPTDVIEEQVQHGKWLEPLLDNPRLTHAQALIIMNKDRTSYLPWVWSKHPNADPDWLAALADERFNSRDQGVIARIAENPSSPGATLAQIAGEHPHSQYALGNPSCPAESLLAAIARFHALDERSRTYSWTLRTITRNPGTPLAVLDQIPDAGKMLNSWERVLDFTLERARSGAHARALVTLAPDFPGTLGDLLTAATGIAA